MEPGTSWVGICPEIPKSKRQTFHDMVMAQTKVCLFLSLVSYFVLFKER